MTDNKEKYHMSTDTNSAAPVEDPNEVVTNEMELQIGGYSNLIQARQEANEFRRQDVFTRRPGMFPNPADFGPTIELISAEAQQWPYPPSPLNQFYVDLKLKATGPRSKVNDWFKKVMTRIVIFHPSYYTRKPGHMGERADHLQDRGVQGPKPGMRPRPKGEPKILEKAAE
jgi:hypothetical protein